jgi:ABC-type phosphate/phosphonate transport system substrate-binding protein
MIRTARILLILSIFGATAAASGEKRTPMPATLRVGFEAGRDIPCAAADKATPAGIARYGKLLSDRLGIPVEMCGFANAQAIANAFAHDKLDFAPLSAAAYPAAGGVRPILTSLPKNALPRGPIVAIAMSSDRKGAADVARGRVATLAKGPLTYDLARATLAANGGSAILKTATPVVGSVNDGLSALQSHKIDSLLLPIDYWATSCAGAKTACKSFQIVWQGRPVPDTAWCLRTRLGDELRYRLVGIHVALRFDDPAAFEAVAGPNADTFDPAEATAFASTTKV